jgi:hypothetical protein
LPFLSDTVASTAAVSFLTVAVISPRTVYIFPNSAF